MTITYEKVDVENWFVKVENGVKSPAFTDKGQIGKQMFSEMQSWIDDGNEVGDYVRDTSNDVPAMDQLRNQRNWKLEETDWWSGSDLTMSADQTVYRKSLRDLPSTASPELDSDGNLTGITWPTKPE